MKRNSSWLLTLCFRVSMHITRAIKKTWKWNESGFVALTNNIFFEQSFLPRCIFLKRIMKSVTIAICGITCLGEWSRLQSVFLLKQKWLYLYSHRCVSLLIKTFFIRLCKGAALTFVPHKMNYMTPVSV